MMPTNFARAAVIAGGLLLAGAATAQQPPQSYFSFLGSFVDPDSNRLTSEEGAAFDLLYGRELSPWLYVEFRGTTEVHETGRRGGSDNYRGAGSVEMQALWGERGIFSAFVLAGAGFAFNDLRGTANDDGALFGNVGIGVLSKALTTADLRLRFEGRARYEDVGPGMTDFRFGLGLEIPIDPTEIVIREVPVPAAPASTAPQPPPPGTYGTPAPPGTYPARPTDSDQDGVLDPLDRCPGTPRGTLTDDDGCRVAFQTEDLSLDGVTFETASSVLTANARTILDEVVRLLRKRSAQTVTIAGHTDSVGDAEYNLGLSLARANSVKRFLTQRGIAANRLKVVAFGESQPIASNDTAAGRERNRRVEFRLDSGYDPK